MHIKEILVTNDDGILAYGLKELVKNLKGLGRIKIVAPRADQSCIGTALTVRSPLYLQSVDWENDSEAWSVTGTPCDCVKIGLSKLYPERKPDLIVSGINAGSNAGRNIFHSGTVAAAILGAVKGIPSIAFSTCGYDKVDFKNAGAAVAHVLRYFQEHPLPNCHLLNVNVPTGKVKGIRMAAQGKGHYSDNPEERQHPEGYSYFWLGSSLQEFEEAPNSDIYLLGQGYATVSPIDIGDLTAKALLEEHAERFERFCAK